MRMFAFPAARGLWRVLVCRFFQDKRVKVSLFLAEGIQSSSGRLILPSCIENSVGMVRTYDMKGKIESERRLPLQCLQVRTEVSCMSQGAFVTMQSAGLTVHVHNYLYSSSPSRLQLTCHIGQLCTALGSQIVGCALQCQSIRCLHL